MAALTSTLLARKGDARPAMRRVHDVLGSSIGPAHRAGELDLSEFHDDLGWNDLGHAQPPGAREQQQRVMRSFMQQPSRSENRPAIARGAKAAFTLRLDEDRHLRLRLASAVGKRSAQQIVVEALDAFLERQPGLDALVAHAPKP